jgi:protein-disulfide isomerase
MHHHPKPRRWGAFLSAILVALGLVVASTGVQAADQALTPAQRSAVDQAIHDYILAHPEIVVEAIKAAQQKNEEQSAERVRQMISEKRKDLLENPDDLVLGNAKGDATLVEFFDYRCPYCKQIEPTIDALLKEDPKLRVVYKEFPILGEASIYATRVALAAKKQGKYPEFHHAMMMAKGDINSEFILKVASSVGLDLAKLKTDIASPDIDRIIRANYDLAEALDIHGTPGLIIGDTSLPGAVDLDTLRKQVALARLDK